MHGISQREFARLDGCDEKVVRRKIASKHLIPFDDGTLNPDDVGGPWRRRTFRKQDEDEAPANKIVRKKAAEIVDAKGFVIPPRGESEQKRAAYLALLEGLNYDREAGLVAPIDNTVALVGAAYSRVRSKFTALPARCASDLALIIDANEIRAYLKAQVEDIFKELTFDARNALDG